MFLVQFQVALGRSESDWLLSKGQCGPDRVAVCLGLAGGCSWTFLSESHENVPNIWRLRERKVGSRSLQSECEETLSWLLPATAQQGQLHGAAVDPCAKHRQTAHLSFGHFCKSLESGRGLPALRQYIWFCTVTFCF